MRRRLVLLTVLLAVLTPSTASAAVPEWAYTGPFTDPSEHADVAKRTTFRMTGKTTITATTWYQAWNGRILRMVASYPIRPQTARLPLVQVFHGAGGRATCGPKFKNAPGQFGFVVACIDGVGRHTRGFSYGSSENLADQARLVEFLRARLPGLRIDPARRVAAGSSMGGQEALMFGIRYPEQAQTIVAMDGPVDMALRFWDLPLIRQQALYQECQGSPYDVPACFTERSPLTYAATLAASSQRLILYWSTNDEISPQEQMPALARAIHTANPSRPFLIRVGNWGHGGAWSPGGGNNEWLADVGLAGDGVRADTAHPAGWRIEVDATTDLSDIPSYYP